MPRYAARTRRYDRRILEWIGRFSRVTADQVLYRFFLLEGRGHSYGERVLRRLIQDEAVVSERLDPELGNASRRVLRLTRWGWRRTLTAPPIGWDKPISEPMREYTLQVAQMVMVREAQGWHLVKEEHSDAALREWMLSRYRHRRLNETEAVIRDRIERMPPQTLPFELLEHKPSGQLRLIAPGRTGFNLRRRLRQMPHTGFWPSVTFEIVPATMVDLDLARDDIERWAKRSRATVETVTVIHHRRMKPVRKIHSVGQE